MQAEPGPPTPKSGAIAGAIVHPIGCFGPSGAASGLDRMRSSALRISAVPIPVPFPKIDSDGAEESRPVFTT